MDPLVMTLWLRYWSHGYRNSGIFPWKMVIFPWKMVIFHSYGTVYQRVIRNQNLIFPMKIIEHRHKLRGFPRISRIPGHPGHVVGYPKKQVVGWSRPPDFHQAEIRLFQAIALAIDSMAPAVSFMAIFETGNIWESHGKNHQFFCFSQSQWNEKNTAPNMEHFPTKNLP